MGHIFDKLRGTVISLAVELRLFNDVKRRRHLGALFAEAWKMTVEAPQSELNDVDKSPLYIVVPYIDY